MNQGRSTTMQYTTALAANSENLNVFQAHAFSRAPWPGQTLTILGTGSADGLDIQVMVAGQLVLERQRLNTNNRVPIMPDDLLISGVPATEGQLIQVSIYNTTAGSLTPRIRIMIDEADVAYY